jgi:hypothetical protein
MSNTPDARQALWKKRKGLGKERKNTVAEALHAQPLRKINTEGPQLLQSSLSLLPDPLDAIFIAIDFEYSHHSVKTAQVRIREVGISILDTHDLRY